MRKLIIFICFAAFALLGCQSKVTGTLEVDGAPFTVKQCRSGQAFNFSGIELADETGRRLRLFAETDGFCKAALFQGGSPTGERIGKCGVLKMETQSSRINSIYNVKGSAILACDGGGHKIAGEIEFENCH